MTRQGNRPDCGASFCAWRRNQLGRMLRFQAQLLRSQAAGKLETIPRISQEEMARQPIMNFVMWPAMWNEVLTTHSAFVAALDAVLVPTRDGVVDPQALRAVTATAGEISRWLGRHVPVLLFHQHGAAPASRRRPSWSRRNAAIEAANC